MDKPAPGSNIENREGACDSKLPAQGFLASAAIVHEEQVCFEVLSQDIASRSPASRCARLGSAGNADWLTSSQLGRLLIHSLTLGGVA